MRKTLFVSFVVLCAVVFVSAAGADQITFALSGNGWNSSGNLYGSPSGPGQWLVGSATGQFNGIAITGIWPTSNSGNVFVFDNIFYWPSPYVDNGGIVLTLANGNLVNFCYDAPNCALPGGYAALVWGSDTGTITLLADEVAFGRPVPEPASLALLGTGVLGLFGHVRRRRL